MAIVLRKIFLMFIHLDPHIFRLKCTNPFQNSLMDNRTSHPVKDDLSHRSHRRGGTSQLLLCLCLHLCLCLSQKGRNKPTILQQAACTCARQVGALGKTIGDLFGPKLSTWARMKHEINCNQSLKAVSVDRNMSLNYENTNNEVTLS